MAKPIECYPTEQRCECCGALRTPAGADSGHDYPAAVVVRILAFIAEKSPSLAILLIYRIAGNTEREIAAKLKISQQAVHDRIARAQQIVLSGSKQNKSIKTMLLDD